VRQLAALQDALEGCKAAAAALQEAGLSSGQWGLGGGAVQRSVGAVGRCLLCSWDLRGRAVRLTRYTHTHKNAN